MLYLPFLSPTRLGQSQVVDILRHSGSDPQGPNRSSTSTWGSHTSTNPKQDKTDGYLLPRTCGQQAMTRRAAQTWTRMTAADS